jgi:hypothetical protein
MATALASCRNLSAFLHLSRPTSNIAGASSDRGGTRLRVRGFLLVSVAALIVRSGGALAGECIDYRDYLHRVGTVGMAQGYDIAVSGSYAYVTDGHSGLQVLDISDPAAPVIISSVAIPCNGIAVAGSYAYVLGNGLQVLDISDPAVPVIVGSVDAGGYGVAVAGSYAYVAGDGLQVIDISDPTLPEIVGTSSPMDMPLAVAVSGSHAYVADREVGLQLVDVSDPTSPTIVALVHPEDPNGDWVLDVSVAGSYAYLVAEYAMHVIDISDPTSPVIVGSNGGYRDYGITVAGSFAYVMSALGLDGYWRLRTIDISNPGSPTTVGNVRTLGSPYPSAPQGVAAVGTYLYVAQGLVFIFDISNPVSPPIVGSVDAPGDAGGVAVAGSHAYVAGGDSGLQVVDVSDAAAPVIVGSVDTPGYARGVAVAGSHAYVADGDGLQVIDISDPTLPVIVGSVDTPGDALGVAVAGSYAYMAAEYSGLRVIDISDPTSPEIVGGVDTPGWAGSIDVAGSQAYVADSNSLQVIDISSPAHPTITGKVQTGANDVAVAGPYAYVAADRRLEVVDISDPASPAIVGGAAIAGEAVGVAVAGSYAYLGTWFSGLEVVDISQPTFPASLGVNVGVLIGRGGIAVAGSHVYLAGWVRFNGLHIASVECEDPTPVLFSDLSATTQGEGMIIRWRASADFAGFEVLRGLGPDSGGDYERLGPGEPAGESGVWQYLDRTVIPGHTYAYLIEGRFHNGETRLFGPIMASGSPQLGFSLGAVRPFPAREIVMVPFSLPRSSSVTVGIYDAAGRLVRSLLNDVRGAGEHLVTWDGRDDAARRLASGMYFVRLSWPGGSSVTRASILR